MQWYIDGQPVGQPGPPEPLVDRMPGDGQVHTAELRVLQPEDATGDSEQFEIPACDSEPIIVKIKDIDFADCDGEGKRPLRVLAQLEPSGASGVVVQWYLDGKPVGQPGPVEPLLSELAGDGGVHSIEVKVVQPSNGVGDSQQFQVPDCEPDGENLQPQDRGLSIKPTKSNTDIIVINSKEPNVPIGGEAGSSVLSAPVVDTFRVTPCEGDVLVWDSDSITAGSWDVDLLVPRIDAGSLGFRHVARARTNQPYFSVSGEEFGIDQGTTILASVSSTGTGSGRSPLLPLRPKEEFLPERDDGPPFLLRRSWDCNDRRGYAWSISEYRRVTGPGDPDQRYFTFGSSNTTFYQLYTAAQASDFISPPPNLQLMPPDKQYVGPGGSTMHNPVWGVPKGIGPYLLDITDILSVSSGIDDWTPLNGMITYFEPLARKVNGPQPQKIECVPALSKVIGKSLSLIHI